MKSWTHLNVRALRTLTKLLLLPTSKHHPILTSTHHPILTSTHHPLLTSTHHPLLTSTHPLPLTCLLRIPSNILLTPPPISNRIRMPLPPRDKRENNVLTTRALRILTDVENSIQNCAAKLNGLPTESVRRDVENTVSKSRQSV